MQAARAKKRETRPVARPSRVAGLCLGDILTGIEDDEAGRSHIGAETTVREIKYRNNNNIYEGTPRLGLAL